MDDDFNSPSLIAQLFEAVKFINLVLNKKTPINKTQFDLLKKMIPIFIYDVLGIEAEKEADFGDDKKLNSTIELLIELRNKARENKNYDTSDQIRDKLKELGIELKDGKDGTNFKVT